MQIQKPSHLYPGAVQKPSPNKRGTIKPIFIVMHYTAGWTAESAISTFANPDSKVSAHLTIDGNGDVYQHVPFNTAAWHAGPSEFGGYSGLNQYSVGIEFVNIGFLRRTDSGSYVSAAGSVKTASAVGEVVKARCPRAGSGDFYWPVYPEAQLKAGEEAVRALIEAYGIIDIVTHEQIDTRGWKTDPGPAFPMNRYRALLKDRKNDVVHFEVTASSLNARTGPGASFKVSSELPMGTRVRALARQGDWVRIDSDNWVNGTFLRRVG